MASLLLAQGLMFLSALLASVGSLDINDLLRVKDYCHWTQLLLSNGVVGCILCVVYWCIAAINQRRKGEPRQPLFGHKENLPWLLARGLAGGAAMSCAWVAMTYLDMAEANVVMFTNPAWTGFIAWLVLGQVWSVYDRALCVIAFACVVLVAHPPWLFPEMRPLGPPPPGPPPVGPPHGGPPPHISFVAVQLAPGPPLHPWHHIVGIGAAIAFAIFLSMASLIINTKLKGKEKPNTVSLYLFLGVIVVDLPFLFAFDDPKFHNQLSNNIEAYMFLGVGVIFYSFQFLRSWALLISNNSSVVNLLYAEIAFSFIWGTAILHQPFFWTSFTGAVVIILGCLIVSRMKSRTNAGPQRQPVVVSPGPHPGVWQTGAGKLLDDDPSIGPPSSVDSDTLGLYGQQEQPGSSTTASACASSASSSLGSDAV